MHHEMILSYLFFSLLLGMRHGLDPDHLAIIKGINLNDHAKGKSTIWSGFFFSLGHGVTVTLIGVLIIVLNDSLKSYNLIVQFTEWIPIVLLLLTGSLGIYNIYHGFINKNHKHTHEKIPTFLSKSKYPSLKLFLTGLFFALVFDTSSQVAAWGLIGNEGPNHNMYFGAILIGLFFTIGMMATDTLNGLFFFKLLNTNQSKFNLKIILSILVVITSLSLGLIQLFEKIGLSVEIHEDYKLLWGGLIMAATLLGLLLSFMFNAITKKKS